MNNGVYAFYVTSCNNPTTVFDATNNWWGIADSAAIEAMVYHHADNSQSPVIDYVPFAGSSFDFDDSIGIGILETPDGNAPSEFMLLQNYLNPFNPITTISFALPIATDYELVILNAMGQEVATFTGYSEPGIVKVDWDASKYASGVHFYKLIAGNFTDTKKMVLLK